MTKTNKVYTVAGLSTLNGVTKMRFANDMAKRVFMLEYAGHTDIRLVELPTEMSKTDAVRYVAAQKDFADVAAQVVATKWLVKNAGDALPTLADMPQRAGGKFLKKAEREEMLAARLALIAA